MQMILLLAVLLLPGVQFAQDCSESANNVLCAEAAPIEDTLVSSTFSYDCFTATQTYFYSFQTGSNDGASADVTIVPGDCDNFLGPDEISIMLLRVNPGSDGCNPADYLDVSSCYGSGEESTYTFTGLAAESHYILVVGSNHDPIYGPCSFSASVTGDAVDLISSVDPLIIVVGETAELAVTGGSSGSSYSWTPVSTLGTPNQSVTSATPEVTTTYTAESTIGDCRVTDDVTLTVGPPIIVYTAFTPNEDGINDGWTIEGIQKFEDALVLVYDRWGQNVFKSLGYGKPWDGTNRGKFLPIGAYYYVIELNSPNVNIPPITGIVSIVR